MNVIVTGASGALGRAVVAHLAAGGWAVAAIDHAPAPAESAAKLSLGGVDLTDESATMAAYASVAKQLGPLHGLVNIAGGFVWELIDGGKVETWDRMYRLNLRSALISSRAILPHLAESASIVNVGAAAASPAEKGKGAYAASKAGVSALTESLADELKPRVRVNAILPTILDTPANRADMPNADFNTWTRPEAAAKLIAFLLSAEAGAVTGAAIALTLRG